MIMQAEE